MGVQRKKRHIFHQLDYVCVYIWGRKTCIYIYIGAEASLNGNDMDMTLLRKESNGHDQRPLERGHDSA